MTVINKQNFLNELGGLLTFMTEEDRLEALTLYEKMFDDTDDEQTLLSALRTPTRQAVVIARAYDANARKQRGSMDELEATPDFVKAILQVYEESVPLPEVVLSPAQNSGELPEEPAAIPEQGSFFEDSQLDEPALTPESTPPAAQLPEEEQREETAPAPVEPEEPLLAAFDGEEPEEEAVQPVRRPPLPLAEERGETKETQWGTDEEYEDGNRSGSGRRPKVFLLILFVLLAIPVALLGVALLLIPALLSLALAAGCIAGGFAGLSVAFSGFAVLADILIVLGGSVILVALGLLFLWLFVWFIGGAIAGLIRSIVQLGRAWCYEEVAA